MKHLRLFQTETAFEAAKETIEKPYVALTDDDSKVHFMDIPTIDEDDLTKGDFIDLGLPSGLKWASCNLGATKPCEYGDYYQWGSVTPNTDDACDWAHAPFNNGKSSYDATYFASVRDTVCPNGVLANEFDAAVAAGKGHMPTQSQFQELLDNTTSEWVNCTYLGPDHTDHTVMGRKFTASNGNSIFIPASGNRGGSSFINQGSYGYVWSSSLNSDFPYLAWDLYFNSGDCFMFGNGRYYGFTVRPVSE